MSYKIVEIEGIGPAYGAKLIAAGVATTTDLLKTCGTATGRQRIAQATGLSESHILKWTNLADLMRISGIGPQFSELLEAAGVDTVKELRNRNAANLTSRMQEVNLDKKLSRIAPGAKTVARWIETAKDLKPAINY